MDGLDKFGITLYFVCLLVITTLIFPLGCDGQTPVLVTDLQNRQVNVGGSVEFVCEFERSDADSHYLNWLIHNLNLNPSRPWSQTATDGEIEHTWSPSSLAGTTANHGLYHYSLTVSDIYNIWSYRLRITNVTIHDGELQFTCYLAGRNGNTPVSSSAVTLTVFGPEIPVLVTDLQNQQVNVGETVEFLCEFEKSKSNQDSYDIKWQILINLNLSQWQVSYLSGELEYTWSPSDLDSVTLNYGVYHFSRTVSETTNIWSYHLHITNVTIHDGGLEFTCYFNVKINNTYTNVSSSAVTLTVLGQSQTPSVTASIKTSMTDSRYTPQTNKKTTQSSTTEEVSSVDNSPVALAVGGAVAGCFLLIIACIVIYIGFKQPCRNTNEASSTSKTSEQKGEANDGCVEPEPHGQLDVAYEVTEPNGHLDGAQEVSEPQSNGSQKGEANDGYVEPESNAHSDDGHQAPEPPPNGSGAYNPNLYPEQNRSLKFWLGQTFFKT